MVFPTKHIRYLRNVFDAVLPAFFDKLLRLNDVQVLLDQSGPYNGRARGEPISRNTFTVAEVILGCKCCLATALERTKLPHKVSHAQLQLEAFK
jgi:hypothetical protein